MKKILIFGAGSIGNHMTYASRRLKHEVTITDVNLKALNRMKNEIYPKRYKNWDKSISLINYTDVFKKRENYDLIIIGTPPFTHLELLKKIKKNLNFKNILIEKPLSVPLKNNFSVLNMGKKYKIFIGYNHSISLSFIYFIDKILKLKKEDIKEIEINWCENWLGIMNAHFWMKNKNESYLSDFKKGGGSLQEHSHGLHLANTISEKLNLNLLDNLSCIIYKDKFKKYDLSTQISSFNNELNFNYRTNLISMPARKNVILHSRKFKFEWQCNYKKDKDTITITNLKDYKTKTKIFKKTRSSEFENEINYIMNCSLKTYKDSPINILKSISVQKIINKLSKNF